MPVNNLVRDMNFEIRTNTFRLALGLFFYSNIISIITI